MNQQNARGQQPAFGGMGQNKFEQPQQKPNVHNFEQAQLNLKALLAALVLVRKAMFHTTTHRALITAFINGSREHYRTLQGAWNHNELNTIEEYVFQASFEDLKAERDKLGEQHTDVMYVDAEIVRADHDGSKAQLSLQFSGRYRDTGGWC